MVVIASEIYPWFNPIDFPEVTNAYPLIQDPSVREDLHIYVQQSEIIVDKSSYRAKHRTSRMISMSALGKVCLLAQYVHCIGQFINDDIYVKPYFHVSGRNLCARLVDKHGKTHWLYRKIFGDSNATRKFDVVRASVSAVYWGISVDPRLQSEDNISIADTRIATSRGIVSEKLNKLLDRYQHELEFWN